MKSNWALDNGPTFLFTKAVLMKNLKQQLTEYYEKNETKVDLGFFLGGFVFDIFTLASVDDPFSVLQQIVYLSVIGLLLCKEMTISLSGAPVTGAWQKIWSFRQLIMHFMLGSLLSIYSLFFLKSSSIFSSIIFVLVLMVLMVANELKRIQQGGLDLKLSLWVICLFSFFAMLTPVALGFVGIIPFVLAMILTILILYGIFRKLRRKVQNVAVLQKKWWIPSGSVLVVFLVFYLLGWVPPVPLSVQDMGIYHQIEKTEGKYILYHERPWWKFWQSGDQDFYAAPNDKIHFFAKIFSPARFSDAVILHWHYQDPRSGWQSTDRIPMKISGGRSQGYRGFAIKQNYSEGSWRVSVETTDGREIGRLYFNVIKAEVASTREFKQDIF